jgi:hypothetical protein
MDGAGSHFLGRKRSRQDQRQSLRARRPWGKAFDNARINDDLTFHDLRGSAVVRLALAGASVPKSATFAGHSFKDLEAILEHDVISWNHHRALAQRELFRL